jgi:uncharacterized membrane protein
MMFNNNFNGVFNRNRVSKADRPLIKPEMTPIDWLIEAFSIMGLMIFLGFVIYNFPKLPETIPSHFNGAGIPDEYSPKSTFWILPGIAVFIYILLSFIALVPHQYNFTVKITRANALKQYTFANRLVRYLKAALICLFFYISYTTIRVAANADSGLGLWFLPVVLSGIFIPLIIYFIAASRNR